MRLSGIAGAVYTVHTSRGILDSVWTTLDGAELRRRELDDRSARVAERALQYTRERLEESDA